MHRQYHKILLFLTLLSWSCTSVSENDEGGDLNYNSSGSVESVTEWMDDILSVNYLYNDEYNTLTRDLTLSYDTFLSRTLSSMTTNVFDNKDNKVYTFVERSASSKSTTKVTYAKEMELSYGLASVKIVTCGFTQYILCVDAVTVDSPLYNAGVRRGDYICSVDGETFSLSNVYGYTQQLLQPTTEASLSLEVLSPNNLQTISVTSKYIYCSPILHYDIYDGGVGYLSYMSFDMAYDDDVKEVFSYFKSEGVTDLILDLRLNTGGHTISANKISTMVGGSNCAGRVFANYQYNPTLDSKLSSSNKMDYFYTSLSNYHLNLDRLYCLVSGTTASASEMVINSLRGVDLEVILIGSQTEGKNVAMTIYEDSFDGWDYTFYPVMIAVSNAKGYGEYQDGFAPDYEVDDWNGGWNYSDFSESEIMVKTALDLISPSSRAVSEVSAPLVGLDRYGEGLKVECELMSPRSQRPGNIVMLEP